MGKPNSQSFKKANINKSNELLEEFPFNDTESFSQPSSKENFLDDEEEHIETSEEDSSEELYLKLEELEEIKETVIQQLVVSYNLYKTLKEFYNNKEKEQKIIQNLHNIVNNFEDFKNSIISEVKKNSQSQILSYISIAIGILNLLLLTIMLLK